MFGPRTTPGIEPPQDAVPVTGVPGGPGFVEQDVHVLDRLHVLYKFRKAMISVTLLVLVAGVVQTYTTTKEYQSTASVRVTPDAPTVSSAGQTQQMLSNVDPDTFMQTELSILNGRDLKLKVVRKLSLDKIPEFLAPSGPQGIDGMLGNLRSRVMQPVTSMFSRPGKPTAAPQAQNGPAMPVVVSPETADETLAVDVLGSLDIRPQQTSQLILITFSSTKPEWTATIPNTLADLYVAQNLERKRATLDEKLRTVTTMLDETKAQIEAGQLLLLNQLTAASVLDPEMVNRQVTGAQQETNAKIKEMQQAEVKMKGLAQLDPDKDFEAAMNHPDILPTVANLKSALNEYRRQKTDLAGRGYGPANSSMVQLDRNIETQISLIKQEVRRAINDTKQKYETAVAQKETSDREYKAAKDLQLENSRNGIPYQDLKEKINAQVASRNQMLATQNDLTLLTKGIENNTLVAERAPIPQAPYKPNASRNILISLAVGLALSLVLAFGLDYLDDTIKTPEDITRKLHIPFLGLVPAVRGDRQPVLSGPVPHDFGEAYRALRTSLVFTSGGESTRMITVTSAQPLEGKTTTACNLAMVLSFGGSRVLLIDADMRRPGVHKTLKMNNTVGLSHLLVGQARVREAIQRTSDPNFCVMTAGRTPPNPSELLASERMKQLIANLKQGPFDWVVVDTPPVLAVTDAVILTPLVDGVVFVLGAEMTRRRLAERAVQMLMVSRPRVVGGVLNRVNFDRNKYYYSRYYGYQYKSYYGTDAGAGAGAPSSKA